MKENNKVKNLIAELADQENANGSGNFANLIRKIDTAKSGQDIAIALYDIIWSRYDDLEDKYCCDHISVKEIKEYQFIVNFENSAHCQAFLDMIKKLDKNLI